MPTPTKGARLGGSPAHERLMLANLATSLFEHGRITTTETKAKRLRPFAERLITKARTGDLHHRREIMKVIRDKDIVHKLVAEIGPLFATRPGGYTRITKTMPRKGDNAPMAVIELITEPTVTAEADRARRVGASRAAGSTAGGSTAGGSTAGGSTAGGSTAGGSTAAGSTAAGSTAAGSTAGGSTAAGSTVVTEGDTATDDTAAVPVTGATTAVPTPDDPAEGAAQPGTGSDVAAPTGAAQDPVEGADSPPAEELQHAAREADAASPVVQSPSATVPADDDEADGPASRV